MKYATITEKKRETIAYTEDFEVRDLCLKRWISFVCLVVLVNRKNSISEEVEIIMMSSRPSSVKISAFIKRNKN